MKTFKEYIQTTTPIVIKKPEQCSEYELILFHQMVMKGLQTKITMAGLEEKAEYLGFYYDGTELAAVGAIKKPLAAKFVFQEAGVPDKASHYKFEIGWSFVEPKYRSQGVNQKLSKALLEEVHNVPVFCTIRSENSASVAAFQKLGFQVIGDPFYWNSGALIMLFVKG